MALEELFSNRKIRLLRELLSALSLTFTVLCCLSFLLAMHFIVAIVVPAVHAYTFIVIVTSTASVAFGIASSFPSGKERRIFGFSVAAVMIYFVIGLSISFSGRFPGLYTTPFVVFGVFGTSKMFGGFVAGNRLFASIPIWRRRPDKYPEQMIRKRLFEFDHHITTITRSAVSMVFLFAVSVALALSTVHEVTTWFLIFGAPFLWSGTVLIAYTRIMARMKRMILDGYSIEERHIVLPLVYTGVLSIVVLVVAGIIAADASPFHYSIFIRFIERTFGIETGEYTGTGYPGLSSSAPRSNYMGSSVSSGGRGGMLNLAPLAYLLRYVVLGGAIVGIVIYTVLSILRMRRSGKHQRQSLHLVFRRGRLRLRLILLRALRVWKLFVESFMGLFRTGRRRRTSREERRQNRDDLATDIRTKKRLERNAVLRWYSRLLDWGKRRDLDVPWSATADEFLDVVVAKYPELRSIAGDVASVFDDAFYSPFPVGRNRLKRYVRGARTIIKR